jgi:hypothetical protein
MFLRKFSWFSSLHPKVELLITATAQYFRSKAHYHIYNIRYRWTTQALLRGTRQRSWLRHYATGRKTSASIPDDVIGFFNLTNPSSYTMTLGSIQQITEMSTKELPVTGIALSFLDSLQLPHHLTSECLFQMT